MYLTHFRPIFPLRRNQEVGFYEQNVWKHLWKKDILSKDADRWPASLLKMPHFHRYFSNVLLVKTFAGLSVSGRLVESGLISPKNERLNYSSFRSHWFQSATAYLAMQTNGFILSENLRQISKKTWKIWWDLKLQLNIRFSQKLTQP